MSLGDISKTNPKPININVWLHDWCKMSEQCLKRFEKELNLRNNEAVVKSPSKEAIISTSCLKEQLVVPVKQSPEKSTFDTSLSYEAVIEKMVKKVKKWINTNTTGDRPLDQVSEKLISSHEVKKISKEVLENEVREALKDTDEGKDAKEGVKVEYLQAFPTDVSKIIDNSESDLDVFLKEELAASALRRKTEIRRCCVLESCSDSISAGNAKDLYHEMCLHVYKEHPSIEGPLTVARIHKTIKPPVSMAGKKEAREKRLKKLLPKSILSCAKCPSGMSSISIEKWLSHSQSHMKVDDSYQCPFCSLKCKKIDTKKRSCSIFLHCIDEHFALVKNTSVTAKEKTHKVYELIRSLDRKFEVRAYRHSARFGQTLSPKKTEHEEEKIPVVAMDDSIVCIRSNSSERKVEPCHSEASSNKPPLKRKGSEFKKPIASKKIRRSSLPDDCVVLVDPSARPISYTCTYCCNQQFTNEKSFLRHITTDHPVCNLKCHDCLEFFTDVNAHMKVCPKQLVNMKVEASSEYSSEGRFVIDLDKKSIPENDSNEGAVKKDTGKTLPEKELQKKEVTGGQKAVSKANQTTDNEHESTTTGIPVDTVKIEAKESTGVEVKNVQPQKKCKIRFFRRSFQRLSCPSKMSVNKRTSDSPKNSKASSVTLETEYENSCLDICSPEVKEAQCLEPEKINGFKETIAKKERYIEEVVNAVNRRYKPKGVLFYCNYKDCRSYLSSEKDLLLHTIVVHYFSTKSVLFPCLYSDCKVTATNFEKEMRPHLLQAHGNTFKKLVESSFRDAADIKKVFYCYFRKCGFVAKNLEDLNDHTLLHNNFLSEKIKRLPLGNLTWSVLWAHSINNRQYLDRLTYILHRGFCPPCNKKFDVKNSFQIYLHLTEHMRNAKDKKAYHESMWLVK